MIERNFSILDNLSKIVSFTSMSDQFLCNVVPRTFDHCATASCKEHRLGNLHHVRPSMLHSHCFLVRFAPWMRPVVLRLCLPIHLHIRWLVGWRQEKGKCKFCFRSDCVPRPPNCYQPTNQHGVGSVARSGISSFAPGRHPRHVHINLF